MKTMILLILLGAAFLGGYYLGQQPDSPDIFGWASKTYHQVSAAGREVTAALGVSAKSGDGTRADVYKSARVEAQRRQSGR